MTGASREALSHLHDKVVDDLIDRIENGEPVFDKDGNKVGTKPCSPQVIAQAIRELERHGILASAKGASRLQDLESTLDEVGPDHTANFPEDLH